MTFSSTIFLALFMPICLLGYLLADKKYRNLYLLIASLIFYAWNGIAFLLIIIISTTIAYFVALLIEKADYKYKKKIMILAVAYNLFVLFYFKYFVVFAGWVLQIIGKFANVQGINIAPVSLPLGISFYTFSVISYIVDVYWEKCKAQKNYTNVMLYIIFFPRVIQGPIMRWSDFESQIYDRKIDSDNIKIGIERFIKGLIKKVIIADQISPIVDYIFSNINNLHTFSAWIGIIGYLLQLYYDFSGYTDMAWGLGRMFGFDLPENFDHPYMSASIPEFWRRWHISLGEYFRDYVYMPVYRKLTSYKNPVTGKKYSVLFRDIIALFVTWVLVGQWHGAGAKFFIYGLWYYLFIVLDRLKDDRKKKLKKKGIVKKEKICISLLYRIMTLLAIIMAQTLFRADNILTAINYIKKLFIFDTVIDNMVMLMFSNSIVIAFIIGLIFVFPVYDCIKNKIDIVVSQNEILGVIWSCLWCIVLLACYYLAFAYIAASGYSPFLYQVF